MIRYFTRKTKGSITIFLVMILTVVLGSSSALLEMGRYHSQVGLFREMTDNAAFSTLACYNNNLYERYGLLAMDLAGNDQAQQMFEEYIRANMTTTSGRAIDGNMELTDTSVNQLYALSDIDILKNQIKEYSKYRAPIYLASNDLGLEEQLKTLVSDLEESVPVLDEIESQTGKMKKFTDVAVSAKEFADKLDGLKDIYTGYVNHVGEYNDAVEELQSILRNGKDEDESDDDFDERVDEAVEKVREAAEITKKDINDMAKMKGEIVSSWEEIKNTTEAFRESVVSEGKKEKSANEEVADWQEGYEHADDSTQSITNKIESTMSGVSNETIDQYYNNINAQKSDLGDDEDAETVDAVDLFVDVDRVEDLMTQMNDYQDKLQNGWNDNISRIRALAESFKELMDGLLPADPNYNNSLSVTQAVSGVAENPDLEADLEVLAGKMDEMREMLGDGAALSDGNALMEAMQRFVDACSELRSAMSNDELYRTQINSRNTNSCLNRLGQCASGLKNIAVAIKDIVVIVVADGVDIIASTLYSALEVNIYASGMFTNRVTDMDSAKMISGDSFPDKMDETNSSGCFDKADMEYLLVGTQYETINQMGAYAFLIGFRILCNILPVLKDQFVMKIFSGLCEIPIIGVFLGILVVILWILVESYLDMAIMIVFAESVPMLKLNHIYLSAAGLPDLAEILGNEAKEMFGDMMEGFSETAEAAKEDDEEAGKDEDSKDDKETKVNLGKKTDQKDETGEIEVKKTQTGGKKFAKNILKLDYRQHLMILLMFVGSKNVVKRMGNLIEADMRREDNDFMLKNSYTYLRVDSSCTYTPILPIPTMPGVNSKGIKIRTLDYCGY